MEQAIAKLKSEIEANKNNSYISVVGDFLVQHIQAYPEEAGKVLAEGKTIGKSLDAMRQEAEKKKNGNVAVLTDAEGFAVVLKYFDMAPVSREAVIQHTVASSPKSKPIVDFDVRLEDLL